MTQINIEFAEFNSFNSRVQGQAPKKTLMRSFLAANLCKIYDESDVSQKTLGKWVVSWYNCTCV